MRAPSSRTCRLGLPFAGLMLATVACHGTVEDAPSGAGATANGGNGGASASGGGPATGGSSATGGASATGGGSTTGGSSGNSGGSSGSAGSAGGSSGSSGSSSEPTPSAFESVGRRLSRAELDNVVRDLLGDTTRPASKVLVEDEFSPFDNDYTLQRASAALIDTLEAFAEDVAARALSPTNRARVVPCTPSGADDTACFEQTVEALGRRFFRRPLTSAELEPYLALQAFSTEDNPDVDNDFYTGIELVLRSILQDPEFLYRIEVGKATAEAGVLALDDWEIASRLSFLLWGSTPDDELLAAAEAGDLADPAGRRREATRLLDDDRAREAVHRFHSMWLGYRAVPGSADLVASFNLETTALIDRIVFDEPANYLTLFTSSESYLDDRLADQYDLPRPAGGEGWVSYGSSGRAGILSHGSVLAAFSKFSDTSPTQRGIFVQTRLLCNTVESPPANVNVDQPPGSDNAVCKLDRYAEHRASSSCAGCHNNLDPIGFGLEAYDVGGRFRTHDDGHDECAITGDGELPGYGTFNGPAELGEKLVASGELERCFVEQLLDFAIGRRLRGGEAGVVADLTTAFAANGYDAKSLLIAFVESERFALRREEPVP
jgi:hypothetical protein